MKLKHHYPESMGDPLNHAYFSDGSPVDVNSYAISDQNGLYLGFITDGIPDVSGSIFIKWTEEVPAYEPKTFLEYALAINNAEDKIKAIKNLPSEKKVCADVTGTAISVNYGQGDFSREVLVFSSDGETPTNFAEIFDDSVIESLLVFYINGQYIRDGHFVHLENDRFAYVLDNEFATAGESVHVVAYMPRLKIFPKTTVEKYLVASFPKEYQELFLSVNESVDTASSDKDKPTEPGEYDLPKDK